MSWFPGTKAPTTIKITKTIMTPATNILAPRNPIPTLLGKRMRRNFVACSDLAHRSDVHIDSASRVTSELNCRNDACSDQQGPVLLLRIHANIWVGDGKAAVYRVRRNRPAVRNIIVIY